MTATRTTTWARSRYISPISPLYLPYISLYLPHDMGMLTRILTLALALTLALTPTLALALTPNP